MWCVYDVRVACLCGVLFLSVDLGCLLCAGVMRGGCCLDGVIVLVGMGCVRGC